MPSSVKLKELKRQGEGKYISISTNLITMRELDYET